MRLPEYDTFETNWASAGPHILLFLWPAHRYTLPSNVRAIDGLFASAISADSVKYFILYALFWNAAVLRTEDPRRPAVAAE
jgi:hypothetical protein